MTSALPRILIVDDSRIVRATLIKAIRGVYEVYEEADGEAGWGRLIRDPAIQVIISDLTMPHLDGYGLLQRIRGAGEARIARIPVLLLSGDEDEASRERAKALGATDFITKGIGTTELLARLSAAVHLSAQQAELAKQRNTAVTNSETGLFSCQYIAVHAAKALAQATRHGSPLTVLVIGLDRLDRLQAQAGREAANQVAVRFGQLLKQRIRQEDSLGHFGDGVFAIVSPETPSAGAAVFARRLREAVEAANMTLSGQRLPLTVSIGVASAPPDVVPSPDALMTLAQERMHQAGSLGGNRVVGGTVSEAQGKPVPSLEHALRLLQAERGDEIADHAAVLALQIMPMLEWANRHCALGLSVESLKTILRDRAQQTSGPSSGSAGNSSNEEVK